MAAEERGYPQIAELAAQLVRAPEHDPPDTTDRHRPGAADVDPTPDSPPPAMEGDRGDPTP